MSYDLCLHVDANDPALLAFAFVNALNYMNGLPCAPSATSEPLSASATVERCVNGGHTMKLTHEHTSPRPATMFLARAIQYTTE